MRISDWSSDVCSSDLFLGHDPWRVTHAIFSPMATYAIDRAYHGWFAPMSLGVLLCAFGARRSYRLRTQYLLSYIAVWVVIGSVFAYLLPYAGPCFDPVFPGGASGRSEEHTSDIQSLMR